MRRQRTRISKQLPASYMAVSFGYSDIGVANFTSSSLKIPYISPKWLKFHYIPVIRVPVTRKLAYERSVYNKAI